jgi:hypothetical protein
VASRCAFWPGVSRFACEPPGRRQAKRTVEQVPSSSGARERRHPTRSPAGPPAQAHRMAWGRATAPQLRARLRRRMKDSQTAGGRPPPGVAGRRRGPAPARPRRGQASAVDPARLHLEVEHEGHERLGRTRPCRGGAAGGAPRRRRRSRPSARSPPASARAAGSDRRAARGAPGTCSSEPSRQAGVEARAWPGRAASGWSAWPLRSWSAASPE